MMDLVLEAWVSLLIERAKINWMLGRGKQWMPGQELSLLFTGYNGTRNTGADVRVEEMLRQIRRILGDNASLSVLSQNFNFSRGYFQGVQQVKLPDIFPPFLYREIPRHHGVVACEGSMFKSKFANALSTMIIGSLGIASAQNKLSVGYGGEAGEMDRTLQSMCRRYCRQSLIITRNEESRAVLSSLGIPTELGTDTAWTFEPLGPEYGNQVLQQAGWDGKSKVLVVCPINPFWWPVRASIGKLILRNLTGAYKDSHYRTIYFHNARPGVKAAYQRYLTAIANAVKDFRTNRGVFVILVAMERLDARSCQRLSEMLGTVPVFTSDQYDMYQLVSILRSCHLMVSSRYHGIVTAMPALVPSAGITMDERIRNLMHERGHQHLLMEVDEPDLENRLRHVLDLLWQEADTIRDGIGRTVAKNLKVMAQMGVHFERRLQQQYPDFPVRTGLYSWEDYLPPFSRTIRQLVENFS